MNKNKKTKMRDTLLYIKNMIERVGTVDDDDPLEMIYKEVEKSLSAPLRVCDVCNTADEAISYAIHLGLVDCNFDARDMAELLLSEVQK